MTRDGEITDRGVKSVQKRVNLWRRRLGMSGVFEERKEKVES